MYQYNDDLIYISLTNNRLPGVKKMPGTKQVWQFTLHEI